MRDRAAQSIIRAYRFQTSALKHLSRIPAGQAAPESIANRQSWAAEALRTGAILQRIADHVDPEGKTNVQNAAWTVLRIEASQAQRSMEQNTPSASNETEKDALAAALAAF
jgi:hypothetical protein